MKNLICILLGLQCPALLCAQGFLQFYNSDTARAIQVWETPGGYSIVGESIGVNQWVNLYTDVDGRPNGARQYTLQESDGYTFYPLRNGDFLASRYPSTDSVLIQRRAPNGTLLWQFQGALGGNVNAGAQYIATEESLEGDLYFYGQFPPNPNPEGFVLKLSETGQLVWSDVIDLTTTVPQATYYFRIQPVNNGECLILSADNNNTSWTESDDVTYITRKSADGQDLAHFGAHHVYYPYSAWRNIGVLNDGRIYQFIGDEDPFGPYTNVRLRTYDNAGTILSEVNITDLFQSVMNDNPYFGVSSLSLADGNFILVLASNDLPELTFKRTFAKITPEGEVLWIREIPQLTDKNSGLTYATEFSDGSIGFVGNFSQGFTSYFRPLFLKFDEDGDIYPNNLKGTAAHDENDNCLVDAVEQTLPYWILNIDNGTNDWYTFTNSEGKYSFQADTGNYSLSLTAPGYLWDVCDNPQTIDIQTDTTTADYITDFSVTALADCPFMEVDIAAPYLRAGVDNTYYVQYCNKGTISAVDVVVSVEVDPLLEFVSASVPHQINDGVLEFHLGELDINDCGHFSIVFSAADNPELYGQSICVTAHIKPDSICLPGFPGWSGALLEARGVCDGDSVRFEVKNIGNGNSSSNLDYIIADDHVIMYTGQLVALAPNDVLSFAAPANGASWRFSSEQEPNVPAGNMPSVQVEGCSADGPPVSQGIAVQAPNNTGSPFSDTQCLILLSDGEPPTLSAAPVGVPTQNFIDVDTEIEYLIQFHPDDIAHQVVIIDTLPADLDPATFSPGPSSHAYSWSFGFDGAIYFYITGNGLQEGFVQFAIKPKPSTQDGTVITNQATLYYDQSGEERTNSVFHTIRRDTITTAAPIVMQPLRSPLTVLPNPANDYTTVQLPAIPAAGSTLLLRNMLGQMVWESAVRESTVRLNRNNLPAGLYWLEYRTPQRILATGKIVWQAAK